ncbi:MAG: hypothetical protein ABL953_03015 [Ilumatobacteraceae bacterium]
MASTVARRVLPAVLAAVVAAGLLGACAGDNPYQSTQTEATNGETTETPTTENDFLPQRENVSDCIGAVERPDCGSNAKGGWQMYLTFGVLIAGMSFIGWRVVRSVRARDAAETMS